MRLHALAMFMLLFASVQARATLIMAFCNGDALYLASDSLQITRDGTVGDTVEKIRSAGKGCLFTLTGIANYHLPSRVPGRTLHFDLPSQMERAFREAESRGDLVLPRITNAVNAFARSHANFCREAIKAGTTNFEKAVFTFWGYDRPRDCFFGLGWACEGINKGVFHASYDSRTTRGEFLQGETDFLSAFIHNHNDFPSVTLSESSKRTWDKIVFRQPVSEEELVPEMVELFAVHKRYSATFIPNSGRIGEPYVVWRLGKADAKRIGGYYPGGAKVKR